MPIEKEKPNRKVAGLQKRLDAAEVSEKEKGWRRTLAHDLNTLIAWADYELNVRGSNAEMRFAQSVLRVVARVAEFEGIRRKTK